VSPLRRSGAARPARAAENVIVAGSRSIAEHASRTRSHCATKNSTGTNGVLNSDANRAASAGVFLGPPPPITIGTGDCTGLGSAGDVVTG
jgi:hypothetical protein